MIRFGAGQSRVGSSESSPKSSRYTISIPCTGLCSSLTISVHPHFRALILRPAADELADNLLGSPASPLHGRGLRDEPGRDHAPQLAIGNFASDVPEALQEIAVAQ